MIMNQISYLDHENIPPLPLSQEVKFRLSLMSAEERIQFVKIATHFAQDPKDEE